MSDNANTIYYTLTDEAPSLATYSLLPIIRTFAKASSINVELTDISLAGRVLAAFPEYLNDDQKTEDGLAFLGNLTQDPNANIIKLPNISASIPQLKSCIAELQSQGYAVPDYPDAPSNDEEESINGRYSKLLGSAVNPVLREGNSDRRAPESVKQYARKFPHSMGQWSKASQSHADFMRNGDFFSSEQSVIMEQASTVRFEFVDCDGKVHVKNHLSLLPGEILDSMFMSVNALRSFLEDTIEDCHDTGVLWSLHMKATMMKVSHPIVFGHAVRVFYKEAFEKHGEIFDEIGVSTKNGLGNVYESIKQLPEDKQKEIIADIEKCYESRPDIAMVDSDKGITNLHVPSDVIVDASLPAMIRSSGKMWDANGETRDTKAVMPESTYARIYQEVINFCKTHGAFDPTTMGTIPNVGLMAKKAEEYGSHDKTYEVEADGIMRIVDDHNDRVLMEHHVEKGDIWRACQTKDEAIRDWVKLAVNRSRASGMPVIFWLDEERAHDRNLKEKVNFHLKEHDVHNLDIYQLDYVSAIRFSMERQRRGLDTIAATGNVLRDYLTDLFPILELGTSAKMLSIVPMLKGGGMYETGAGGSAPKHVQQVEKENHLRWDSLGEFLATAVSIEELGEKQGNAKANILAKTLDSATGKLLENNKSPSRKCGELDNRGSHFYLAMYWAEELASQTEDSELAAKFVELAKTLADNEAKIVEELNAIQGEPADLGGYYHPDASKLEALMRPSKTLNEALASV